MSKKATARAVAKRQRARRLHLAWAGALCLVILATGYHVVADRSTSLLLSAPAGSPAREAELNAAEIDREQAIRKNYDTQLIDNAGLDSEALKAFTGDSDD